MSGKSTKIIIACKIITVWYRLFFLCIYEWLLFKQAFNLSQICHHDSGMTVLYRLSYYCIPFGKVAYDSINQLRALRNVLPCLICTCIVHWYMKSLEISIVTWMFFILMHLSLQIFLQTSDFILYLCTLSVSKSTWLNAFYVCIVYSMAFILCNIYTYSRTNLFFM